MNRDNRSGKPAGKPETTMPPRCDEYSGGGGSFPDTRNRAMPGHKEGDCSRIGNAPDTPTDDAATDRGRG